MLVALAAGLNSGAIVAQEVESEEMIVTGFRQSLEAARDIKRANAHSTDAIVAEDIGKMPDLNLAESLQRVPGIAITREGGEGRNITVRGLGPGFTRTTLNGMEVPASTGGLDSSGGVNRSRDFDFNVFGSELFNKIVIHKSSTAHIEEGGLASTVELSSHKPFDNPGRTAFVSVQNSFNMHTSESDPRLTALYSQTFADDTFGVLAAITHSKRNAHQEGFGTVRWTAPATNGGRSWVGTDADVNINGTPRPSIGYPEVSDSNAESLDYMWHPRLPRMDSFNRDQTRTGFTGAIQFKPSDSMTFGLDIVGSKLEADVTSYNYFAQFRNLQNSIEPTDVTIDSSGRYIIAGTFDNVAPRSESRGQFGETDFLQTVLSAEFALSDSVTLNAMYGKASSEHIEEQYRFNITASEGSTFSYSFEENSNVAEMSYGFDITDPDNYGWSGPTFRHEEVNRDNDTLRVDLTATGDNSYVKAGIIWNSREVDSEFHNPINITPTDELPALSDANTNRLSEEVDNFGDAIDAPSGFPTDWLVSDFNASIDAYNAGDFELDEDNSNTYNIVEKSFGAYVEAEVQTDLLGKPFTANAGLRVVETDVTSRGVSSDGDGGFVPTELQRSYTEVLPSTNLVWELQEDLLLRLAMGRNISRPGLGSMAGTVNVTPINGNVSVGNPGLNPVRANSVDLGVEWYFADESLLSFTLFHKQIESFITGDTLEGEPLPADIRAVVEQRPEYDPSSPLYDGSVLDPASDDWNISTSVNGDGADLDGYEIGYQQTFDFLPGVGVLANYTHVESEAEFGNGIVGSLEGLSENSYNLGVFYENDMLGGRIMINNRDDYVSDQTGSDGNASHGTTGPTRVDLSSFWNVTDNIKLTLEVINLTNEKERLYTTGILGDQNLIREYNSTGTEVMFGVRAQF